MISPQFLHQIRVQFDLKVHPDEIFIEDLVRNLSAVIVTPDGNLWVGGDESVSLERLKKLDGEGFVYGEHQSFELADFFPDINPADGEVDIEGLDYDGQFIWIIGSHSSKRKKLSDKSQDVLEGKDLRRISKERNRYLLGRIPLVEGELQKESSFGNAACLPIKGLGNPLTEALLEDKLLGRFVASDLPGKENGFDIEGLVTDQNRIFIGLRGPVLRGIAIILEIEVTEKKGLLKLKPIGTDEKLYKMHFVDLDGLGIRELDRDGDDILILAGPTMDLDGNIKLFRLKDCLNLPDNSISRQKEGQLEMLFEIPHLPKKDRAEGLTIFSKTEPKSIIVLYDSPNPDRILKNSEGKIDGILGDIFAL